MQQFSRVVIEDGEPAKGLSFHQPAVDGQVAELLLEVAAAVGAVARVDVARPADLEEGACFLSATALSLNNGASQDFTPVRWLSRRGRTSGIRLDSDPFSLDVVDNGAEVDH